MAVNEVKPWTNADPAFASLDLAGYNYLPKFYGPDHERVPSRVIVATESFPSDAFTAWMGVVDSPHVIGDFVWTGMDYLGESGIGHAAPADGPQSFLLDYPWHISGCGDLDLCGWKRPQSYYRDVLWRRGAPVFIVAHAAGKERVSLWGWPTVDPSWTWPVEEGTPVTVDVYTTAARIDLFLNGTRIGSQPASRGTKFIATFTVPYTPGTLRAEGFDESGAPVGVAELVTAGPPASLRATVDRREIRASRDDLAYVTVEVLDAAGRRVPDAERLLRFSVAGPGELAGHANGNPRDASSYRGTRRTTYAGRALAVLRPTGQPGNLQLRVDSDGLTPSIIDILAR
jgi:beta-galactosidase